MCSFIVSGAILRLLQWNSQQSFPTVRLQAILLRYCISSVVFFQQVIAFLVWLVNCILNNYIKQLINKALFLSPSCNMPLIHHPTQRPNATKQVREFTKTETHSKRPGVILIIFTQLARHKKKTALLAAVWIRSQRKVPTTGQIYVLPTLFLENN